MWRYYNGRADCENVNKERRAGFALPTLCLAKFWATEAALSLAVLSYSGGKPTVKLAVPQHERGWGRRLGEKTLSRNDAVGRPAWTTETR